ncbi:hypothetical protein EBE87_23210 [Pseudoroseomonas wenyumeiae]|uniref:Uncharacterized protein n=1 Tax=Teichococcus wenyumeiae TaxID=2478470 RepID=A0A3A9JH43_9PROT|nr:hypothetical protein [Pseudoroseomonas wenyumeiae]RKK04661.1 hypothetical protein D6Z83_08100 [Pseudoroseomonas wenyumeiae]RMI17336.1 hypothetical protein EBE87_23210 [Pseudoroseomonas wenyumeiae]
MAPIGSPAFLNRAVFWALDLTPRTPAARALVATLVEQVLTAELAPQTRRNQRHTAGLLKLRQAVGAMVGGLLRAWWHPDGPRPAWRSNQAESFTPKAAPADASAAAITDPVQTVGRRVFKTVIEVLKAEALIVHHGGVRLPPTHRFRMGQGGKGKSARYWPTDALLQLAQAHGLTPTTIRAAFRAPTPRRAPQPRALLELRPFRKQPWDAWRDAAPPGSGGAMAEPSGAEPAAGWRDLEDDVAAQNALAAAIPVRFPDETPCYPPQWYRVFSGSRLLQGRWYAVGNGGDAGAGHVSSYASLGAAQRARLQIGGEAVVELDVSASHLALLLGLLGSPPPDGNPYEGHGFARPVVKQWVMEACGKGRPPTFWSRSLAPDVVAQLPPIKDVGAAVMRRFPALAQPALVVPEELVAQVGQPAHHLVTHYLAAREAEAMTLAMRLLRQQGILALPVHDSLIVPVSTEAQTHHAITKGYLTVCGLSPRIKRK